MKRLIGILIALLLVAVMATPAFAQGPRRGDVFCGGGSIVVSSEETPDSVLLFGCGARIKSGARVNKDVVSFGGNVVIEKDVRVGGDMVVFGGNVDVAGQVQRDVTMFGGSVTLQPTAVVDRDVLVFGGFVDKKEGAVVRGHFTRGEGFDFGNFRGFPFIIPSAIGGGILGALTGVAFGFVRSIIYALALAALGALTVVFLPAQTKQVGEVAEKSALASLGVGCLTLIVFLPLFILLIILILTIPIALLLPIALVIAWLFGWIAIGRLIGEKLMVAVNAQESWREPVIAVAVGVILLAIITALPIFGWLISLFVGTLAVGAVILSRFGTRPYPMPLMPAPVAVAPVAPVAPTTPSAPAAPSEPTSPASNEQLPPTNTAASS